MHTLDSSMKVKDVMLTSSKAWDIVKINGIFDGSTVRHIINTPLLASVRNDKLVWKLEHDGNYSVRSAYKYCINNTNSNNISGIAGNWNLIWQAKTPPKVKNLLWRIGRNVLPTRARLNSRGVQCPLHCDVCNDSEENSAHVLFLCPRSIDCWQRVNLWDQISAGLNINNNISDNLFSILQRLDKEEQELFGVMVWSIWKRRNNQVWDNITDSNRTQLRRHVGNPQSVPQQVNWEKPSHGRYKCNIDASFSPMSNKVCIGMCIRDTNGCFVAARTEWMEPILDVDIGEAMGLLRALNWMNEIQLTNVDLEMDCKRVVDNLYSSRTYRSDLGDILSDCRTILTTSLVNSHVKFIRRQANEAAHRLARVATSLASFRNFIDLPTCITDVILNEMR
ncbi:hypothetical protein TSUD_402230 [Trifolium subterraneum]|uniref:RNase H type-1 domain-containing protein n=1 Tax=Trifolium subterraneum TaxID=3900 RepID=A0A2Z6NS64_TRISU|nr:hypothetical protein TSUD_402230 [Trifolium subterraneum]